MTQLFAQPYDINATGFYFQSQAEYAEKSAQARNAYGFPIEEYELQFIAGEDIDAKLFEALSINQCNFAAFLDACDKWTEEQKIKTIIAVSEGGYDFDLHTGNPDDFDVDLYEMSSLRELAERFVEEGLFGTIPKEIEHYLDYDAIARNLGFDYGETVIAGKRLIYRCL